MFFKLSVICGNLIFISPILSLFLIAMNRLWCKNISEKLVTRIIVVSQSISLACLAVIIAQFIQDKSTPIPLFSTDLLRFGENALEIGFMIDLLTLPFLGLTVLLGAIVGVFASRYLHRDPGYFRFFLLFHFFLMGMFFIVLSGNLSGIFIGWEIVGLTSALLIAFFSYRKQTVSNSLRAFWAYRVTDTGLLLASLISINLGLGKISELTHHPVTFSENVILALCLFSAMGKSAQFPFGHWLPKAMEGPTPSSAIFYGGLAVHAGVYLILRVTQDITQPLWFSAALIIIGLITATYGSLLAKIQSDVKSTLAFSAMAQVGFIFCELGLGLRTIAVTHFVGHALLRTYQLLNASSQLHDYHAFQGAQLGNVAAPALSAKAKYWESLYSRLFWENYQGFSERWSMLKAMEKLSNSLRSFDLLCNKLLFKLFRKLFVFANFLNSKGGE